MAWPPLLFILVFCLSLFSSTRAEEKPCTGRNAGKYYDLNRLQAGKDYTLTTPGGNELVLSACKSVSHETWGLKVQDPALVGGFVRRGHGDFSIGQTNTTLSFAGRAGHPHLTLASGSKCRDENGNTLDHLRGSTEIEFVCDPSAGAGSPRLVAQLPPGGEDLVCAWFLEWRTAAACPTSEGTTFGGILSFLLVSLLVFLAAYLVIGTLYNFFILNLAGTDALPRFSIAGMLYHGREASEMAGDWWASRQGGGSASRTDSRARGPVGLGGPNSFSRDRRPDLEQQGSDRSFDSGRGRGNGNANGNANPFIRTGPSVRREQPLPTPTNPASHQTQVMGGPAPAPPNIQSMPAPVLQPGADGLNPVSHQTQLMAGMPVPQLPAPEQQNAQSQPPAPVRRETAQTFSVGDDEEDAPENEIAEGRGRMGAGAGGGDIRL
ncbi:hypothetical protein B0H15DRAFT_910828 [Mycena belliarum]|uniref:Autophagy-related protein 27 n=1 Tax=Mycena belliarum TaxID=1033014 RepID=A0AAD6TZ05_9AGAR|nr:hypothetical protein B0H15DRAFT_910828 [Mycena belliae]